MTKVKKLGIWMDYSTAQCMNASTVLFETTTITSEHSKHMNNNEMNQGEKRMHAIEQNQQARYFSKLSDIIKEHDEVILFGPTDAKVELFNELRANHHFDIIKIELKTTDKMTDNQRLDFVKDYFN